jgi:hypothetical protein
MLLSFSKGYGGRLGSSLRASRYLINRISLQNLKGRYILTVEPLAN